MLLSRMSRLVIAVLVIAVCTAGADRRLLWQTGVSRPAIWAISFSPDGQSLAVGVADESGAADVVIIDLANPNDARRAFPVPEKVEMWIDESRRQIRWGGDGACLWIVSKTAYAVGDSSRCATLAVHAYVERSPNGQLMATIENREIVIRDLAGKTISRPQARSLIQTMTFVGNRFICFTEGFITPSVACAEAISGRRIAQRDGWWPRSWSGGGTRLALTDYHPNLFRLKLDAFLDIGSSKKDMADHFRRRLVWDIQTDRVIASWDPPNEKIGTGFRRFAFALSPDGRFLAEGAAGYIRLYKLR